MRNLFIIAAVISSFYVNSQNMSTKLAKWEAGNKQVAKEKENEKEYYSFCFQNKEYQQITNFKCVNFESLQKIGNFANFLDSLLEIPIQKDQTMTGIKFENFELSISKLLGVNLITFYPDKKNSAYTWLGKKDIKEFRKLISEGK